MIPQNSVIICFPLFDRFVLVFIIIVQFNGDYEFPETLKVTHEFFKYIALQECKVTKSKDDPTENQNAVSKTKWALQFAISAVVADGDKVLFTHSVPST